jgi:hypothetical protein
MSCTQPRPQFLSLGRAPRSPASFDHYCTENFCVFAAKPEVFRIAAGLAQGSDQKGFGKPVKELFLSYTSQVLPVQDKNGTL